MANHKSTPVCGVYKITCTANGKFYIGSSDNIAYRWMRHRNALKRGHRDDAHLQRASNAYGWQSFRFELIEACPLDMLRSREQAWISQTRAYDESIGFNIASEVLTPMRGRKMSPEAKALISKKNRGKKRTPEQREHYRGCRGSFKLSAEARKHISEAAKARTRKPHATTTRTKMSLSSREHHIVTDPEFFTYDVLGLQDFCREHSLNYTRMSSIASGKAKPLRGWMCAHVEDDRGRNRRS